MTIANVKLATSAADLKRALHDRSAVIGILGLGYVGLPLAMAIAKGGYRVVGFDIDPAKVTELNKGVSYIGAVTSNDLTAKVKGGRFRATDQFSELRSCDVLVICVPTPLTKQREPDLTFIEVTAHAIAEHLRPGQLISLESTTYPGTTNEVVKPILEKTGLRSGKDFFLAYSPEREDPGSESPSLKLMKLLLHRGTTVDFHDPFVPTIPSTREHPTLAGRASVEIERGRAGDYDAVLVATDHDAVDHAALMGRATIIVDTRNAFGSCGLATDAVIKA
jgi:UDP-N-acetyl-D-mannosaminuronate dehydrogenase